MTPGLGDGCSKPLAICAASVTGKFVPVELEGIGHWVPEMAAEQVNELLTRHLAGQVAARNSGSAPSPFPYPPGTM